MKNAYVLEHHRGDDGTVTEGMILTDMSQKRFEALKKRGLVREATAEEVEQGHQHNFVAEADRADGDEIRLDLSADSSVVQQIAEQAKQEIEAAQQRAEDAEKALAELREDAEKALTAAREDAEKALTAAREDAEKALTAAREDADKLLGEARAEAEKLRGDLAAALEKAEKQQPAPANKKAAEPANKGA